MRSKPRKTTTLPILLGGDGPKIYTIEKMAELSGKCRDTIYEHARKGLFPNIKVIGKRDQFISHEDATMYLGYDPVTGKEVTNQELDEFTNKYNLPRRTQSIRA